MGGKSGGTTTQIIQPTPTPQPSTADAIQEYVKSLPALYEAQLKYAPLEAEQQVNLATKYATPYAQAYQEAQNILYPGTAQLQERLAGIAGQGINANVPRSIQDQYRSDLLAQLGTNASSGIGADYVSRGLINQQEDYNRYYQSLGLSLAGRQPLVNAQTPSYTNQLGNYQPGQGLQYTSANYGTFSAANRPIVTQNQQGTPNWIPITQSVFNAAGAAGGIGGLFSCFVASRLFGGWYNPKTIWARFFITVYMPQWFREAYIKHGPSISKSRFVFILRPIFEVFAFLGRRLAHGA